MSKRQDSSADSITENDIVEALSLVLHLFIDDQEALRADLAFPEDAHTLPLDNCQLANLQNFLEQKNYDDYAVTPAALNELLANIRSKRSAELVLGQKIEYTCLEFEFDETTKQLNAIIGVSSEPQQPLSVEMLEAELDALAYRHFLFQPNILPELIKRAAAAEYGSVYVADQKDAEAEIVISDDKMSAFLSSRVAHGGKPLSKAKLMGAVLGAGIDLDICDKNILERALTEEFNQQLLAQGKVPEHGTDAKFTPLVSEVISHAPKVDQSSGTVNHLDTQDFVIVEIDTALMTRTPATAGVNGFDVMGQVLPAVAGNDLPFSSECAGASLDPKNRDRLIASVKGHPIILADGVKVDKTLTLENVDIRSGNVDFDGSLIVSGEVCSDMTVKVTGDVFVNDVVSSATIIAGNDVIIKGGLIGHSSDDTNEIHLSAKIVAGGSIHAQFASMAKMRADKNIEINEYIAHCDVRSKEKILVGQNSGRGNIFGGRCHAKETIIANIIGTEAGIKTLISAGSASTIRQNIERLKTEKKAKLTTGKQLNTLLVRYTSEQKDAPLNAERLDKVQSIKATLLAIREEIVGDGGIDQQIEKLKQQFSEAKLADIIVRNKMYANTLIMINGFEFPIREQTRGGHFVQDGDDIRWNDA